MNHIGLFEGIGGFSLAARAVGWQTIAWCEINDFCQKVLSYHFPEAKKHDDIRKTDFTIYRGKCDILTGGFPCQPFSIAGKQLGTEDERHLWPEMLRAIREIQPRWVVGENVGGILNWNGGMVFEQVHIDLENEGYEVQAFVLPAVAVNAPHRRDRIWFVAFKNSDSDGWNNYKRKKKSSIREQWDVEPRDNERIRANNEETWNATNADNKRLQRGELLKTLNQERSKYEGKTKRQSFKPTAELHKDNKWRNFPTKSAICGGNDGLPSELDGITVPKWKKETIKAYGNAIVPQVAIQIFKSIIEYESAMDNRSI